jgi:hypothetical protein
MSRVVYTDLDGTMVGPLGCFFRTESGELTLEPARALIELHEAGVHVVLVSGRTRVQLLEMAAVFGADGFIAELGSLVAWGRGSRMTVQQLPGTGEPASPALVDELTAGFDLALYEPWSQGHEVDVLLRGCAPVSDVHQWLADRGAGHLRLRDNGVLPRTGERVYHLLPDGVDKGSAVAFDLRRRGLTARDAIAIGDSESDLDMAAHVGWFWLTANGARHAPGPLPGNVSVTAEPLGLGWAQAVRSVL